MKMRNPYALHGRTRHAGPFRDRRLLREGVRNLTREWMKEAEEEGLPSENREDRYAKQKMGTRT